MKLRVELAQRAKNDIDVIIAWIAKHSPQGARTWSHRLQSVLEGLSTSATTCALAPEDGYGDTEIRQLIFKTRRGKPYRILFTIRDDVVFIRHVRGPGQDLVPPGELLGPNESIV